MQDASDHRGERTVSEAIARLRDGGGSGLVIVGAPGMGRSTLASVVRERASTFAACASATVRGSSFAETMRLWQDLTAQLVTAHPQVTAADMASTLTAAAAGGDHRLVSSLTESLEAAAAAGPVALFVDDAHRAGATSTLIVDALLSVAERLPLLVTVTAETESEEGTEAVAPWHRWLGHSRTAKVDLDPLPDSVIRAVIRENVPTALSYSAEQRVVRVARGNPRLARELAFRDAFTQTASRTPAAGQLLIDGPARRIVAVCEREAVLATLAIADRPLPVSLLCRALRQRAQAVPRVLERSERAGIVEFSGTADRPLVSFTHPLFAELALVLPSPERIPRARAALAQAITAADPAELAEWTPAEIATHFMGTGDHSAVSVRRCLDAARWCESHGRPADAIDFSTYALMGTVDPSVRHTLLTVLGRCAGRVGDHRTAIRALSDAVAVARGLTDPGLLADTVADLATADRFPGASGPTRAELSALLAEAIEVCSDDRPETSARVRAVAAETLREDDFPAARDISDSAVRLVREYPRECRRVADQVLATDALVNGNPHGWDRVREHVQEVNVTDPAALGRIVPAATGLFLAQGDAAALASLENRCATVEDMVCDIRVSIELNLLRATRALLSGDVDGLVQALRRLPAPLSEEERIMPAAMAMTWTAHTGRALGIEPRIVRPPRALPPHVSALWASTETVLAAAGNDAARRRVPPLARRFREAGPPAPGPTWSQETAVRALAAGLAGDAELSRQACEALTPYAGQFAVYASYLPVAPIGWLVAELQRRAGDLSSARAANLKAENTSRGLRARWWIARCLLQRARLFRRGNTGAALDALDEAQEIARELDSAQLFEEATKLRERLATPGRPIRETRRGPAAPPDGLPTPDAPRSLAGTSLSRAGLTSRELDVLRLAAVGLRNADIAARLHLSVSTVERHCTNIYRKLDVRNRAQALGLLTGWESRDSWE
ncbi:LuxR C-terminal-related transcriptional regulator [Streptomyces sp. NBC_00988]|uniref:helix-turn-helix transcriptional regulator n=1 Tax=Streptomyces sp. NBC_00988 TaxID=2903704 RepID=UPI0038633ABE|nr:LuxR C-terminal-related transcriptional regulator [Streptomyces sp. NBC_00988]